MKSKNKKEKTIDSLINENRKMGALLCYVYAVVQAMGDRDDAKRGIDMIDQAIETDFNAVDWR